MPLKSQGGSWRSAHSPGINQLLVSPNAGWQLFISLEYTGNLCKSLLRLPNRGGQTES